jgi:CheY-like chemotaxis protein
LDYKLSDMSGDDVARRIKQVNGIKIILISAYELDEQMTEKLKQDEFIVIAFLLTILSESELLNGVFNSK